MSQLVQIRLTYYTPPFFEVGVGGHVRRVAGEQEALDGVVFLSHVLSLSGFAFSYLCRNLPGDGSKEEGMIWRKC